MSLKRSLATTVAAGAMVLGVATIPALAQDAGDEGTTSTTEETTTDATSEERQAEREAAKAERRQGFAQDLSDKLDVPVDDVATALGEIRAKNMAERQAGAIARLDDKLAAGEITQERYDEIVAAIESGEGFRGGPGGRHGHRGHRGPRGSTAPAADAAPTATATAAV